MLISRSPSPTTNGAKLTGATGSARHPSAAGPKDRSTRSSIRLAEYPQAAPSAGPPSFSIVLTGLFPGSRHLGRLGTVAAMRATFEKVPDRPDMSWHCYVRRAERFPFGWHYHDEAELTLILSGAGQRFVGDSIERYEAGDFVLIGPNVPHS